MLSSYFGTVLTLCLFLSVGLSVAHPRFKSVTNLGAGVLIICAIMLPLVDIIRDFDIDDSFEKMLDEFELDGMTDSAIEDAFEDGIAQYVSDRWGVDRECIVVNVDGFDMESLSAQRIYVTLGGMGALVDYKRIEEALIEKFTRGGECEVSLKIGYELFEIYKGKEGFYKNSRGALSWIDTHFYRGYLKGGEPRYRGWR